MTTCIRCEEPALAGLARCAMHERRRRYHRDHDRERAAELLASRSGKGRRTDLEHVA